MVHPAFKTGGTAVISGSAYGGIGYSFARRLAIEHQFKVVLADNNSEMLEKAQKKLVEAGADAKSILIETMDVTKMDDWENLAKKVYSDKTFSDVDVLHLNAGVGVPGSKCWTNMSAWQTTLGVNLWGVINGAQAFVGKMLENRNRPGIVICTGSKQGITCPPGNACYNVSKAGVKAFTEQLAHELRTQENSQMTAHLLIPGYVFSKLTSGGKSAEDGSEKPDAAWTADQTVDYMFQKLEKDDFYIICPDGEVTEALDKARMEWSANDVALRRPALSRWHPDYKEEFEAHIKKETGK